ncbi:hypothetical protein D3C73_1426710 [compost metagenome]
MANWVKVDFRDAAAKTVISPDAEDSGLAEPVDGVVVPEAQPARLAARLAAMAPATSTAKTGLGMMLI